MFNFIILHTILKYFSPAAIPFNLNDDNNTEPEKQALKTGTTLPANVIVMYRGYVYSIEFADLTTKGLTNDQRLMTPKDMSIALQWIVNDIRCNLPLSGPGVPALTNDNRDKWAANREKLLALDDKNVQSLQVVETAVFCLSLRDDEPQTESEVVKLLKVIGDRAKDMWADKCFTIELFKSGFSGTTTNVKYNFFLNPYKY